jgi:hypothetical protein
VGPLAQDYGVSHACHKTADITLATLRDNTVKQIFAQGLHEFLEGFIGQNNWLGFELGATGAPDHLEHLDVDRRACTVCCRSYTHQIHSRNAISPQRPA